MATRKRRGTRRAATKRRGTTKRRTTTKRRVHRGRRQAGRTATGRFVKGHELPKRLGKKGGCKTPRCGG